MNYREKIVSLHTKPEYCSNDPLLIGQVFVHAICGPTLNVPWETSLAELVEQNPRSSSPLPMLSFLQLALPSTSCIGFLC